MADRLLLSEAIEAVGRMIRGYANSGQAGKSYIGAMAELLMRYPRQVALGCSDPFKGVALDTKFLPTTADVVAWCERAVAPMYAQAERDARVEAQLQAREDWQNHEISPRLKAMAEAWLMRTDPAARELAGAGSRADEAAIAQRRDRAMEVNNEIFVRECRAAGIDPTRGVSPSLLKSIGGDHAEV